MLCLLWIVAVQAAAAKQPNPISDSDAASSQEVVVTGERVKRSLRETASSIHVATEAEIEAQPVDRVEQVLALIPNVQVGSGSEGPAIRGQDTTGALQALPAFLGGNRPRTTVVVDGRAVTYNEFVFGVQPAWDVERVEVFRSPQTTTQGQNSIAGAIFVHTNKPGFGPEYRARGIIGNFGTRQLSAVASGPIAGDSVAVRVAGDLRYSRTTSEITDRAEGADPNHDVYGLVRAKVLIKPTALPHTEGTLTYAHLQSQAPQIIAVTEPFEERRDASGFYGTFRINVDSLTGAIQHKSGDVTANIVLTAGNSIAERLAFPGLGQARIRGRDWSGETVLNWTPTGPLQVTGGVSRRHVELNQRIDLSVLSGIPHFRDWQDGAGIFGEASWSLSPRAKLTAGLRYQRDRQRRVGAFDSASGAIALDYDRSFHAWLPKVSVSYDISTAVAGGLLVQRAYNPGGTTLRFDIGQPDNFEAETLWDYEAFVRATTADGQLSVAANLFYYHVRNAQRAREIRIFAPNGLPVGFADLFNVPKARSYGMEVEGRWRPTASFSARVGLGLLRSKIVEAGADYPEFEGKEFARAPHLTAFGAVEWRPLARLLLSAQARHHSGYFSDPVNGPFTRVGRATIADARAEYRLRNVSIFGYARNLLDTFSMTSRDENRATLENPREVGIGFEASL